MATARRGLRDQGRADALVIELPCSRMPPHHIRLNTGYSPITPVKRGKTTAPVTGYSASRWLPRKGEIDALGSTRRRRLLKGDRGEPGNSPGPRHSRAAGARRFAASNSRSGACVRSSRQRAFRWRAWTPRSRPSGPSRGFHRRGHAPATHGQQRDDGPALRVAGRAGLARLALTRERARTYYPAAWHVSQSQLLSLRAPWGGFRPGRTGRPEARAKNPVGRPMTTTSRPAQTIRARSTTARHAWR